MTPTPSTSTSPRRRRPRTAPPGRSTAPRRTVGPLTVSQRRGRLAGGLFAGLALATGASLVLPAGDAAAPVAAGSVTARSQAAQVVVKPSPVTIPRRVSARASRGGLRTPVRYVRRTVAVGASFSGDASWYGGSFQGQRTANGEHFDTNDLTAASKTLPFGTRLRVCRYSRCVVVRVNDRGPYVGDRILDLSQAASQAIGYSGVAYVNATPVATRSVAVRPVVKPVKRAAVRRVAPVPVAPVPAAPAPVPAASSSPDDRPSVLLTGGLAVLAGGGFLRGRRRSYAEGPK